MNSTNNIVVVPSIGVKYVGNCSKPQVSIDMPFIRPCFTDQRIYVKVFNSQKTQTKLRNKTLKIELDKKLIFESSNVPLINLGNNQYSLIIDSLLPGHYKEIIISAQLKCDSKLGESVCLKAFITDPDSCTIALNKTKFLDSTCNSPYDDSNLEITGNCSGDSVLFIVRNVGSGNMTCFSDIVFSINGSFTKIDSVLLNASDSVKFSFNADGRTYWAAT